MSSVTSFLKWSRGNEQDKEKNNCGWPGFLYGIVTECFAILVSRNVKLQGKNLLLFSISFFFCSSLYSPTAQKKQFLKCSIKLTVFGILKHVIVWLPVVIRPFRVYFFSQCRTSIPLKIFESCNDIIFIFYIWLILFGNAGQWCLTQAYMQWEVGQIASPSQKHKRRTTTHVDNHTYLELPFNWTCMLLDCGRKTNTYTRKT